MRSTAQWKNSIYKKAHFKYFAIFPLLLPHKAKRNYSQCASIYVRQNSTKNICFCVSFNILFVSPIAQYLSRQKQKKTHVNIPITACKQMNKIPKILQVFYYVPFGSHQIFGCLQQKKYEIWMPTKPGNKMKSIRYIWSFMPFRSNARIKPNNLGLKSYISMLMSTLNFSFVYVFIIIYCWSWEREKSAFWYVNDMQHKHFIEFSDIYHYLWLRVCQQTIYDCSNGATHEARKVRSHWIRGNFRIIFLR